MATKGNRIRLAADRALYLGDLPATRWHHHAAPVLLIGLSGDICVGLPGGRSETCRSALIDGGVEHALDSRGERVASIYLEPDAPEVRSLRECLLQEERVMFNPVGPLCQIGPTERRLAHFELASLLTFPFQTHRPRALDPRIREVLPALRTPRSTPLVRADMATMVNLSESRFNHLFTAEMGICFRRYRSWSLMRSALYQLARKHSFTDASLHAGFYDSAHFSRVFRDMIGLTPSSVLRDLQAFEVLAP